LKVDEMGCGMWHAWEINLYIVWWEHLKGRDYVGNLRVDRQVILKLVWMTWWWQGGGLSWLDTSDKTGSGI